MPPRTFFLFAIKNLIKFLAIINIGNKKYEAVNLHSAHFTDRKNARPFPLYNGIKS